MLKSQLCSFCLGLPNKTVTEIDQTLRFLIHRDSIFPIVAAGNCLMTLREGVNESYGFEKLVVIPTATSPVLISKIAIGLYPLCRHKFHKTFSC